MWGRDAKDRLSDSCCPVGCHEQAPAQCIQVGHLSPWHISPTSCLWWLCPCPLFFSCSRLLPHLRTFSSFPPHPAATFNFKSFPWRPFSAWVPRHLSIIFQSTLQVNFSPWLREAAVLLSPCKQALPGACSFCQPLFTPCHPPLTPASCHSGMGPLHSQHVPTSDFSPQTFIVEYGNGSESYSIKPKRPPQCNVMLDCTYLQPEIPNHTGFCGIAKQNLSQCCFFYFCQ